MPLTRDRFIVEYGISVNTKTTLKISATQASNLFLILTKSTGNALGRTPCTVILAIQVAISWLSMSAYTPASERKVIFDYCTRAFHCLNMKVTHDNSTHSSLVRISQMTPTKWKRNWEVQSFICLRHIVFSNHLQKTRKKDTFESH